MELGGIVIGSTLANGRMPEESQPSLTAWMKRPRTEVVCFPLKIRPTKSDHASTGRHSHGVVCDHGPTTARYTQGRAHPKPGGLERMQAGSF